MELDWAVYLVSRLDTLRILSYTATFVTGAACFVFLLFLSMSLGEPDETRVTRQLKTTFAVFLVALAVSLLTPSPTDFVSVSNTEVKR